MYFQGLKREKNKFQNYGKSWQVALFHFYLIVNFSYLPALLQLFSKLVDSISKVLIWEADTTPQNFCLQLFLQILTQKS